MSMTNSDCNPNEHGINSSSSQSYNRNDPDNTYNTSNILGALQNTVSQEETYINNSDYKKQESNNKSNQSQCESNQQKVQNKSVKSLQLDDKNKENSQRLNKTAQSKLKQTDLNLKRKINNLKKENLDPNNSIEKNDDDRQQKTQQHNNISNNEKNMLQESCQNFLSFQNKDKEKKNNQNQNSNSYSGLPFDTEQAPSLGTEQAPPFNTDQSSIKKKSSQQSSQKTFDNFQQLIAYAFQIRRNQVIATLLLVVAYPSLIFGFTYAVNNFNLLYSQRVFDENFQKDLITISDRCFQQNSSIAQSESSNLRVQNSRKKLYSRGIFKKKCIMLIANKCSNQTLNISFIIKDQTSLSFRIINDSIDKRNLQINQGESQSIIIDLSHLKNRQVLMVNTKNLSSTQQQKTTLLKFYIDLAQHSNNYKIKTWIISIFAAVAMDILTIITSIFLFRNQIRKTMPLIIYSKQKYIEDIVQMIKKQDFYLDRGNS